MKIVKFVKDSYKDTASSSELMLIWIIWSILIAIIEVIFLTITLVFWLDMYALLTLRLFILATLIQSVPLVLYYKKLTKADDE